MYLQKIGFRANQLILLERLSQQWMDFVGRDVARASVAKLSKSSHEGWGMMWENPKHLKCEKMKPTTVYYSKFNLHYNSTGGNDVKRFSILDNIVALVDQIHRIHSFFCRRDGGLSGFGTRDLNASRCTCSMEARSSYTFEQVQ